jgi:formylglycine-generating enzyme required for sulfatase activity
MNPLTGRSILFAAMFTALGPATGTAQEPSSLRPAGKLEVIANSIGMKLVRIPAGQFRMGSPGTEAEREPEEALHEVAITRPFWMGAYEVTQAEYAKIESKPTAHFSAERGGGPDHPVENIEWNAAVAFCNKLSALAAETQAGRKYRLPTEAEWEYACRAGTTTPFHFGRSLSASQANFNGNYPYAAEKGAYLRRTAKVGSYPPNAFGLYDMHGNVAEWCADWYDPDYYNSSPEESPRGPPVGVLSDDYNNFFLVVRGGCWLDDARACRSASRHRAMHRNSYRLIGFRAVCEE